MRTLIRVAVVWCAMASLPGADPNDTRKQLIGYLDGIAGTQLAERKAAIAQLRTAADMDQRKTMVRDKILGIIGGLPERNAAVAVKETGTIAGDGFRVEKIAYESLPGFWVTANVYVPAAGPGPFPAIVIAPGHGAAGKLEDWNWGVNFARNGILVMAYDPLGQGERLQYFDAESKKSRVGNPTGEHGEANIGPLLIGDNIARYMVNDGMRGVDYLGTRKDVDSARIGAFGCSGGGTATAYLAALDERVKVAASACYITSFQELLASATGVQDAEQALPHFIERGLDLADWVELFAPKPYAIVSTESDMFPFAGARQSFEEAKRVYGLYDAGSRIQWITGPGGHGNLGPIAPAIIGFFTKHLKGSAAEPLYTQVRLERREDLQVTPTGQVATSYGGETVYSINRKRAAAVLTPPKILANKADLESLQTRIRRDIRALTGSGTQPTAGNIGVTKTEQRPGYRLETIALNGVSGFVVIPDNRGSKPAAFVMDSEADPAFLAKTGRIVMVLEGRPNPPGTESVKSPYLGIYNLLSLRAFLVGKTIIGLRIDDALRAIDWLTARQDVGHSPVAAYGTGALGMTLLHAAVLDGRIGSVALENTLVSYRMVVDQPLHRNVSEMVIPGVLRKYDTGDLLLAAYPRQVTVVSPRDAAGDLVSDDQFRSDMGYVFQSLRNLGSGQPIRLVSRKAGDALPLD